MTGMRRKVLAVFAVVYALLCGATIGLWERSHRAHWSLSWTPWHSHYEVACERGQVFLVRFSGWGRRVGMHFEIEPYSKDFPYLPLWERVGWGVRWRAALLGFECAAGKYKPAFSLQLPVADFHAVIVPQWFVVLAASLIAIWCVVLRLRRVSSSAEQEPKRGRKGLRLLRAFVIPIVGVVGGLVVTEGSMRLGLGLVSGAPLQVATWLNDAPAVRLLLHAGCNVNARGHGGQTALAVAARDGHKDIAEILLRSGANVNARDDDADTPLREAATRGRTDLVALLLAHGADVNAVGKRDFTPLHSAAHRDTPVAEMLLDAGAAANARNDRGETPLHIASWSGGPDLVRLLIARGADVNAMDDAGRTPLHAATEFGKDESVRELLRHGADVNAGDAEGRTPLHVAWEGHLVEILLAAAADVKAMDDLGFTPLHAAARGGAKEGVEVLLRHGADLHATDNSGATPLHVAGKWGREDTLTVLLSHGADPSAENNEGKTPLDLAKDERCGEVVDVLTAHMAKQRGRSPPSRE